MLRRQPAPLMQVIVGNQQLRELAAAVIPLLDVVDPAGFHDPDTGCVVQFPHKLTVVVTEEKLAVDAQQGIPQTDVVGLREAVPTFW